MGGEIGVESRVGSGSTFWFSVALAPAAHVEQPGAEDLAIDAGAVRLLLVEDTEANQELVSTILRSVGVEVDIVSNGAEAVEAVQVCAYDLVLMDVHMPVMGGVQATQIIRSLGGGGSRRRARAARPAGLNPRFRNRPSPPIATAPVRTVGT